MGTLSGPAEVGKVVGTLRGLASEVIIVPNVGVSRGRSEGASGRVVVVLWGFGGRLR